MSGNASLLLIKAEQTDPQKTNLHVHFQTFSTTHTHTHLQTHKGTRTPTEVQSETVLA